MTVDESAFRTLCKDLEASYRRLGRLRDTRPRPPEVRSALKPAPGPQAPGNGVAVWTLIDCETRLRQVAFNALGDVCAKLVDGDGRAFRLCQLMAFHAYDISRLGWAADLMEELQDQDGKLTKAINRIEPAEAAPPKQATFQTADVIIRALATKGHGITKDDLHNWSKRGKITRIKDGGTNLYNQTDIIRYLDSKAS